jgi:4-nitrophenyl phosphatase
MRRPTPPKAWLIDIEGVLVRDKRYEPVDGAVQWINTLVSRNQPFCLVSNQTTDSPEDLVARLVGLGFHLTREHLVGVLDITATWLRQRNRQRIMWLGTPELTTFWQDNDFDLVEEGSCDAVLLGTNSQLQATDLDRAMGPLMDGGADLICLHRNMFFLDDSGQRRLGVGAWAAALEALNPGGQVVTVGKPAETIYNEALKRLGVSAPDVQFISDDPINDLITAGRMGMQTAFVLSGKYPDHDVLSQLDQEDWPGIICASLAHLEEETTL